MDTQKGLNLLENKRIAIVGGGPGGLTLALLLQRKGADVTVYERDYSPETRIQGAIVDLHADSGLKVIKAAGLLDAFKAAYMPGADKFRTLDQHANICVEEASQGTAADFEDEHFRPEIDRGALRNVLLNALSPDTVVWDSQLTSLEEVATTWHLTFKNGTTAVADLVIGADGYRSKIRPYLTDGKAVYSGATIIQGEIDHPEKDCPEIYKLVDKANLVAIGVGKSIAAQPRGDGGLTFYASSLYAEDWLKTSGIDFTNQDEVYAYLVDFYEGWNPVFYTLFKACNHFVPRPLTYFPLDQPWATQSTITLIGDAAHLMPPSGEGVNTAMLDALDLSECLTNSEFADLQTAIAAYEGQMRARAVILLAESLGGIKEFASPSEASVKELVPLYN
ncbi:NAD(P)-binding protein [Spirosoma sp. HMF4905]|uniref:Flavin-dependent monooxygenase n=1 Tax=Spirosoma arboris TaxID=2682092 RepID=A0A7K1S670_9BACT|nr:NAD(P)/FAD-dependent oxidoreductase [Spirosoma arboris]MVM29146.1 NAD(P)-binding protein [Spirosoma arboris]